MTAPDYEKLLVRANLGPARTQKEDYRYNFGTVLPGTDLLPIAELAEVARQAVLDEGRVLSFYPPDLGPREAREFVARKLREDRGLDLAADDLLLTNGSNEAIRLVLDAMVQPGDVIITEENLYLGSLRHFRMFGAEVLGVETDDDGMRMDRLAEVLEGLARSGRRAKFIYTISTFQNPEGTVLSVERRHELLRLAQRYETMVLEDDCYIHERLDIASLPPATASLPGARDWVMYCSTFSKILGPGIRFGWVTAPAPVLHRMATWKHSGGNDFLVPMIVCRYLDQTWDARIRALGSDLKLRRDAMAAALEEHFGGQASFFLPRGGMFLWVRFPESVDTGALLEKASEAGVRYNPGVQFSPTNGARNYARMAFAFHDERTIHEGVAALARVLYREGALPLT
jgi:2-aminoadipate transaminase